MKIKPILYYILSDISLLRFKSRMLKFLKKFRTSFIKPFKSLLIVIPQVFQNLFRKTLRNTVRNSFRKSFGKPYGKIFGELFRKSFGKKVLSFDL